MRKIGLIGLMGLIGVLMLASCKTYIPVPEYHTVYVEKHDTLVTRDSIFEKDSIYIIKSGDTITTYHERILYKDRWRDKIVYRDSIRVDSIRVPYPVEMKLNLWERSVLAVAKPFVAAAIVALISALILYLIKKFRR